MVLRVLRVLRAILAQLVLKVFKVSKVFRERLARLAPLGRKEMSGQQAQLVLKETLVRLEAPAFKGLRVRRVALEILVQLVQPACLVTNMQRPARHL